MLTTDCFISKLDLFVFVSSANKMIKFRDLIFNAKWYSTALTEVHMVYTPGYGWYIILGLYLTPKQREVFKVHLCNWWEKWEKVALLKEREKKTWYWLINSNPENMTNNIHLFYNNTTYPTIFNSFINIFSLSMCVK